MQIQRIQSIYLLIAAILQAVALFLPWWTEADASIRATIDPYLTIIGSLAALLSLMAIFLFKNLQRQKLTAAIAALVSVLAAAYGLTLSFLPSNGTITLSYGLAPMIIGSVFDILARRSIIKDEKLLRSADRIR